MMRRATTAVMLAVLALTVACSGDGDATATLDTAAIPTCDELFAAGTPTAAIAEASRDTRCVAEYGERRALPVAIRDCTNGRKLAWNDLGWGYLDGDWHTHQRPDGQLVPPQTELAACLPNVYGPPPPPRGG